MDDTVRLYDPAGVGRAGVRRAARIGIVLVGAAFLVLGALWATIVPPFEKPDEINHFAYIQFLAHARRLPVQGRELDQFLEPEIQQPPAYYVVAAAIVRLAEAAGVAPTDLGAWRLRIRSSDARSPRPGAAFWSHDGIGVNEGEAYPFDLALTRLGTLLLGLLGVALTWRIARAVFPGDPWLAVGAAALVAYLPQYAFAASGATNDPLAWAIAAAYLLVLLGVRDRSGRSLSLAYVLLGLLLGVGLLTKATLLALVPLTVVARPRSVARREWVRGLVVWGLVAAAVCGWWFVRSAAMYGDVLARQEVIDPSRYAWNIAPKSLTAVLGRPGFWIDLWQSSIGRFGFMNIWYPAAVYRLMLPAMLLVVAGFAAHLRALWRSRTEPASRSALWSWLVVSCLPLLAFILVVRYNLAVTQPQGRYLFASLPAVALIAAAGISQWAAYGMRLAGRRAPARGWAMPGWVPSPGAAAVLGAAGILLVLDLWALFGLVIPAYGAAAWSLLPGP